MLRLLGLLLGQGGAALAVFVLRAQLGQLVGLLLLLLDGGGGLGFQLDNAGLGGFQLARLRLKGGRLLRR